MSAFGSLADILTSPRYGYRPYGGLARRHVRRAYRRSYY